MPQPIKPIKSISPSNNEVKLDDVVGSILGAVQNAKHLGDLETSKLLELYKKEKNLSTLTVPAFAISDVEIELHFAIADPSDESTESDDLSGLKVHVAANRLKDLNPSQIHLMKFKIMPVILRTIEED